MNLIKCQWIRSESFVGILPEVPPRIPAIISAGVCSGISSEVPPGILSGFAQENASLFYFIIYSNLSSEILSYFFPIILRYFFKNCLRIFFSVIFPWHFSCNQARNCYRNIWVLQCFQVFIQKFCQKINSIRKVCWVLFRNSSRHSFRNCLRSFVQVAVQEFLERHLQAFFKGLFQKIIQGFLQEFLRFLWM